MIFILNEIYAKNENSMQKNERSRKINSKFNELSGNIKKLNIQNIFI